jgi:hypothetical protein
VEPPPGLPRFEGEEVGDCLTSSGAVRGKLPLPLTERRKFERLPVQLSIEVRSRGLGSVCQTADVSRHGLFLATPTPARERQLLILRIPLPDGGHPIDVMASVARSIPEDLAQERALKAGMGVNFFALTEDNKERWERFLASLRGETPKPQAPGSNRPTFLLQPKDQERLRLFEAREFALGSMFLRTPVLRRVGESLRLILLHPVSDEEFPLLAQVVRVSDGSGAEPKGMVLDFQTLEHPQRAAFHEFVEHGTGVTTEPPPSVVDAVRALPDEPLGQHPALVGDEVPSEASVSVDVDEGASVESSESVGGTDSAAISESVAGGESAASSNGARSESVSDSSSSSSAAVNGAVAAPVEPPRPAAEPPPRVDPHAELRAAVSSPPPTVDPHAELRAALSAPPPAIDPHAELRTSLMAKPDDVSMLFRLGSALARDPRNAAEAVALLTRLLALEPQHALAHAALAWAYGQLGQRTDAKLHLSRLRRLGLPIDPALEHLVTG